MSFKRNLFLLVTGTALSACNTIGSDDVAFGEAAKFNAALQTIDPTPIHAPNAAQPGNNGDRGARAVKRYRTDTVKEIVPLQTTSQSGSSSGSSSGTSSSSGESSSGASQN